MGEDLAAAHGGWKSIAHKRYARFSMAMVSRIPGAIVGQEEPPKPVELEERDAHAPSARVRRGADATPTSVANGPAEVLPNDWRRDIEGLVGPEGARALTVNDAWRSSMVAQDSRAPTVDTRGCVPAPAHC